MEYIHQRTSHDCGVAALAMFTGKSYEEMLEMCLFVENEEDTPIYREGWGMNREYEILKRLGLWSWNITEKSKCIRLVKPQFLDAEYFRQFAWGRRALFAVPSLNIKDGWHFICYDGKNVLDPNHPDSGKNRYTNFEEIRPTEMYLMRETNDI